MTVRAEDEVKCLALGRDTLTKILGDQVIILEINYIYFIFIVTIYLIKLIKFLKFTIKKKNQVHAVTFRNL